MRGALTILRFALICACLSTPWQSAAQSDEAFGERVRDYLLSNPEVILEVMELLQERQEQIALQNRLEPHLDALFGAEMDLRMGSAEAPQVIVEFFDYNCPVCKANMPALENFVAENPDVAVVKKHLPIISPASERAARYVLAARAVYGSDTYNALHNKIYAARGVLNEASLADLARADGLDHDQIMAHVQDAEISALIDANRDMAIDLQIIGTPVFLTKTLMHIGSVTSEVLQSLLDDAPG